ncbi:MAG: sigma-70 family RNA polymerase sigma factor [Phycisphaerae bacterium]|nr:sigma-70 family RNA polymerase sigma factor [Phycisphaerae bacterium]
MRLGLRGSLTAAERDLLDRLVREQGPRLLAYVRHAHRLAGDADDIVAETFCRAAMNIAAVQGSGRPDLYLLTVARNLCCDRFRRPKSDPLSEPVESARVDAAASPHETAVRGEQVRALRAAVRGLPDHLREIVVLRLSAGLKFEEIAELLKIPLGTALSRMHAAVERLRTELGQTHEQ